MKKVALVFGILLILYSLVSGIPVILNISKHGEFMIGYLTGSILLFILGILLTRYGFKKPNE